MSNFRIKKLDLDQEFDLRKLIKIKEKKIKMHN
jgi:hypothetical protein